jgi:hypothetical protein
VTRFELVPLSRDEANAFVLQFHRHCGRCVSHRGAIGCEVAGQLVGVAIIGNPKAKASQQADRFLIEIVRVCVAPDAPRNVASWLYARARRAAAALGFRRVETKNLASESGASLRGAGFQPVARLRPRKGWNCPSRPRGELHTDGTAKVRWEASA